MRIAIVSEPWDDVVPGGSGSAIAICALEYAPRLARRASVWVYSAKRVPGRPHVQRDPAGVEYRRVSVTPEKYFHRTIVDLEPRIDSGWFKLPYWASTYYYRSYIRKIALDIATRSIDVVHVQSFAQFVPMIRRYNPKAKIVLHVQNGQVALLDQASMARYLRDADMVIGCGESVIEGIRSRHPEHSDRCRVLYNGVDVEQFAPPTCGPRRAEPDVLRCLHVARMSPEKGLHVLLEAFERVQKTVPQIRLDVWGGSGPLPYNNYVGLSPDREMRTLKAYYEANRIAQLKASLSGRRDEYFAALEGRYGEMFGRSVFFHGAAPHDDLRQVYQNADLFILPSVFHEPFGIVLVEAMGSALPVVTTHGGDLTEAIASAGAGLVVGRNDPVALADAMLKLANDPALRARMGQRGRAFVSSDMFSWDRIADQLREYYDELMAGSSPAGATAG